MSYLILPNGVPDFNKAVISFWFRIPQQTINNVYNRYQSDIAGQSIDPVTGEVTPSLPRMSGIIPLLTFGQVFDGYQVEKMPSVMKSYMAVGYQYQGLSGIYVPQSPLPGPSPYAGPASYKQGATSYPNPSFIGINCQDSTMPFLQIRLQGRTFGSPVGINIVEDPDFSDYNYLFSVIFAPPPLTDSAWDFNTHKCIDNFAVAPGNHTWVRKFTWIDYSALFDRGDGPSAFNMGNANNGIIVQPDAWHHILLSFDLSSATSAQGSTGLYETDCGIGENVFTNLGGANAIASPCQGWLAFDDVNYTNIDNSNGTWGLGALGPSNFSFPAIGGLGRNGIAPTLAYVATVTSYTGTFEHTTAGAVPSEFGYISTFDQLPPEIPSYAYTPGLLPTAGYPLGIPCVPSSVSHEFHHVEMAEFQMFTGVTLDTSDPVSRKAFIDYPTDSNGIATKNYKTAVNPTKAQKLLGKRPDVLLHGSSKWIHGANTGSIAVDAQGKPINGQFTPTGNIKAWKPEPALPPAPQSPKTG